MVRRRTATFKGFSSDVIAQTAIERRPLAQLDVARTTGISTYNALFHGLLNVWKYGVLYPGLFGDATTFTTVLSKLAADFFVAAPLIYFPSYFIVKGAFKSKSPFASIREYAAKGQDLLLRYYLIFIPTETVMWIVIPPHLRVPFLLAVSLIWQVLLSTLSNREVASAPASTSQSLDQASRKE